MSSVGTYFSSAVTKIDTKKNIPIRGIGMVAFW